MDFPSQVPPEYVPTWVLFVVLVLLVGYVAYEVGRGRR